jgi:hypothetical protein
MKKHFLISLVIVIFSCSNSGSGSTDMSDMDDDINFENQNLLTYQISNNKVFSKDKEQVENVNFLTINSSTNGLLTSKITASLGSFEVEKKFDLNLQITRNTNSPKFQKGVYNIVGPEFLTLDLIEPPTDNKRFAVVNAISIAEYKLLKHSGLLADISGEFVFQENSNNLLFIDKVEDVKALQLDNLTGLTLGEQLVEGYAIIHLMEVNSSELFFIRIDFKLIHDIRVKE